MGLTVHSIVVKEKLVYKEIAYPYIVAERGNTLPVSLVEVKSWLKLNASNTFSDAELTILINSAVDTAEALSKRLLVKRAVTTKRVFWGEFRNGLLNSFFTLRRCPIETSSVVIKYDTDNTLDTSLYKVQDNPNDYACVKLDIENLPELEEDWFPIEITFNAGYTTLPSDLKIAILQHVASMWLNRGDCDDDKYTKIPTSSMDTYRRYRIKEIGA